MADGGVKSNTIDLTIFNQSYFREKLQESQLDNSNSHPDMCNFSVKCMRERSKEILDYFYELKTKQIKLGDPSKKLQRFSQIIQSVPPGHQRGTVSGTMKFFQDIMTFRWASMEQDLADITGK